MTTRDDDAIKRLEKMARSKSTQPWDRDEIIETLVTLTRADSRPSTTRPPEVLRCCPRCHQRKTVEYWHQDDLDDPEATCWKCAKETGRRAPELGIAVYRDFTGYNRGDKKIDRWVRSQKIIDQTMNYDAAGRGDRAPTHMLRRSRLSPEESAARRAETERKELEAASR